MSSDSEETKLASTPAEVKPPSRHGGWLTPTTPAEAGQIPLGTILAERYRVVGLLGRGGMGEVYRAEDLRLGQIVALKFVPAAVADDSVRLAQFHNEVRIARQVSHRNVCRVYDIGEAAGRVFLTMEYVDGEDLATLLKRIGRLPQEKGVEIARQVCAGLAVAHEQGVLHRDLKPANIMLDGNGRVRITDFGLAGVAEEIQDVRSGTPAYMAPEQLAGREVSVRSDIFALGLVLYELFTGKRAFEAKTVPELLRLHDAGVAVTPTSSVRELDPAIERVIQRCLEREPAQRPTSAIAVAAALTGGDPLAAALAAGETPSPEMVAAAGRRDALRLPVALTGLSIALLALLLFAAVNPRRLMTRVVPFDLPPQVLFNRAQATLRTLGYLDPPVATASGFVTPQDYIDHVNRTRNDADRWRELQTGRAPVLLYWYRTSPRPLVPDGVELRPSPTDPALDVSGMTLVIVDTQGRLVELQVMPPQQDAQAVAVPEPDWTRLFSAANIDPGRFASSPPEWIPFGFADRRAAWTGTLPEYGSTPIRLEAAAYRGRPTYFSIVGPWTRPSRMQRAQKSALSEWLSMIATLVVLGIVLGAVFLARRNVRLGRGDRQGARRLAAAMFAIGLGAWALGGEHYGVLSDELDRFFIAVAFALLQAGMAWLLYLAVEPLVRRYWPKGLVSWTRLLAGQWRDPLVGRDVLAGVGCGIVLALIWIVSHALGAMLGYSPPAPRNFNVDVLEGTRFFLAFVLVAIDSGIESGVTTTLLFVVLRALLGRTWLAVGTAVLLFGLAIASEIVTGDRPWLEVTTSLVFVSFILGTLVRFGLLALVTMFAVNVFLQLMPVALDASTWYASFSLGAVGIVAGLAVWAFVISRAGEPLFGKPIFE